MLIGYFILPVIKIMNIRNVS